MKDVVIDMQGKFEKLFASLEFKEEYFVAEAQARLDQLLDQKGVTRAELARKLGVTRARVTQIFSDDATNLTLRLLARSYLALGEEPVVIPRSEYERLKANLTEPSAAHAEKNSRDHRSRELLTASLIAEALKVGAESASAVDSERSKRRHDTTREWAEHGSNVVPMRRAANG